MTTKDRLHRVLDTLPDSDLPTVARVLDALAQTADPARWTLDTAPLDDEPYTDEERAAVAEGWEDVRAGRVRSSGEVKRELGL